jgi:histidinol dehydrogenase
MAAPLVMRRLATADSGFTEALDSLIAFESAQDAQIDIAVASIIADVRKRGDAAVLDCTRRFDRLDAASVADLEIDGAAMADACATLPAADREALTFAAQRVRAFHQHQKNAGFSFTDTDGSQLGQRVTPLDRVGIYVPGGKAAYPSSVLMNAIPAQVAGVREIVMVFPTPDGMRNALVLAAAHLAGVTKAYTIGGAQAIAALAYGTQTIAAVDKICGPGNAYVAAAKRRVFGTVGLRRCSTPSTVPARPMYSA